MTSKKQLVNKNLRLLIKLLINQKIITTKISLKLMIIKKNSFADDNLSVFEVIKNSKS